MTQFNLISANFMGLRHVLQQCLNTPNNIHKSMYLREVKSKYTEHQHGGQSPPEYLSHLHNSLKLKQGLDKDPKLPGMVKNKGMFSSLQAYPTI